MSHGIEVNGRDSGSAKQRAQPNRGRKPVQKIALHYESNSSKEALEMNLAQLVNLELHDTTASLLLTKCGKGYPILKVNVSWTELCGWTREESVLASLVACREKVTCPVAIRA